MLLELMNKEADVRNTEGYEVELGTNALKQLFTFISNKQRISKKV